MRLSRCCLRQFRAALEERLDYYSQFNPSPLSVKQFTDFGEQRLNFKLYLILNINDSLLNNLYLNFKVKYFR